MCYILEYIMQSSSRTLSNLDLSAGNILLIKVNGPFVETSCVFQCIKNIINAEMWA